MSTQSIVNAVSAVVRTSNGEQFDGTLTVEQEIIMVRSDRAVLPDSAWRFTDAQGHEHRWQGRDIPTLELTYEHQPCDGACGDSGCEGYSVERWLCRQCGERVKPSYIPDEVARTVGHPIDGLKSWRFDVVGFDRRFPISVGDGQVNIATKQPSRPERHYEGRCAVTSETIEMGPNGVRWEARLDGISELVEQVSA